MYGDIPGCLAHLASGSNRDLHRSQPGSPPPHMSTPSYLIGGHDEAVDGTINDPSRRSFSASLTPSLLVLLWSERTQGNG